MQDILSVLKNFDRHDRVFLSFAAISLLVFIASLLVFLLNKKNLVRKVFTRVQRLTLGAFASVAVLLFPVYCYSADGWGINAESVCQTIYNSFRVFILEGDFTKTEAALSLCGENVAKWIGYYVSGLFLCSAFLTFGSILSIFGNIIGGCKFNMTLFRDHYIMSELNECSIAMAESIADKYKNKFFKPLIVFTEVFTKNEEEDYSLLLRARSIGAICLKKDISHLNIGFMKHFSRVEFFLMGLAEAENVEQAIQLVKNYKNRKRTAIYVYSARASSGNILDSIDKGNSLINPKLKKKIRRFTGNDIVNSAWFEESISLEGGFYISRIDSKRSLVLDTLCKLSETEALTAETACTKTVSVMIVGLGIYGKEFLKSSVWFFQTIGYKVEINAFEVSDDGVEKRFEQECPELFRINPSEKEGDASYDIRIFTGVDCFSSDFNARFSPESDVYERLKRTQMVFVSLGDDDKNIDAAIMLRSLFDKVRSKRENIGVFSGELPIINSIVFDDRKASNLNLDSSGRGLVDYKNEKLNIRFIGSLKERHSYDLIEQHKENENKAFKYHLDWVHKERQLREACKANMSFRFLCYYYHDKIFKKMVDDAAQSKHMTGEAEEYFDKLITEEDIKAYLERQTPDFKWGDSYFYPKSDYNADIDTNVVISEVENYVRFEYYRNASIAKHIHQKYRAEKFFPKTKCAPTCLCEICLAKRITEHMRWNAYMRTEGYEKSDKKVVRAKLHNDLVPWEELAFKERFKD